MADLTIACDAAFVNLICVLTAVMLLFHGLFVRYICCCCQVDFGCSVDRNAAVPHFLFLQIDRCVAATVAVDLLG